jgi:hypothetical protein
MRGLKNVEEIISYNYNFNHIYYKRILEDAIKMNKEFNKKYDKI